METASEVKAPVARTEARDGDEVARGGRWAVRMLAFLVFLAAIAFGAYAAGLSNTALFHHVASTVRDPVADNTILHSPMLFGKIFGPEFLLSTRGVYEPLGFAAYALIGRAAPADAVAAWHAALIAVHALTGMLVFLTLRAFVRDWTAAGLAAAYLVFPPLAVVVNDVNAVATLFGLFWSAATLALFAAWLRRRNAAWIILSAIAFAAAAFTFPYALAVPAMLALLWAAHGRAPRATAALVAYTALIVFAARLAQAPMWVAILAPYPVALVALAVFERRIGRLLVAAGALAPFVAVAGAYVAVASTMHLSPIFLLGAEEIDIVAQPGFVARMLVAGFPYFAAATALAALVPLALAVRGAKRAVAVGVVLAVLFAATVRVSGMYKSDVAFWGGIDRALPGHPLLKFNLATALVEAGSYEDAKDMLLYLRYGQADDPPAVRMARWPVETTSETASLVDATAQCKLGRVYEAAGNESLAGYYLFPKFLAWNSRVRKHRLAEIGDFCFRKGYISWAENHYASCLIMDPYDVRLYNALGKCLVYKNFFRAARQHFDYALLLEPRNETALYYGAFTAKTIGDDEGYEGYAARWRAATGATGEPDFQAIVDGFRFDRDGMITLFSRDPMEMLKYALDKENRELYTVTWGGRTYDFSAAPVEVARYFIRKGRYDRAYEYLLAAQKASPSSREALALLVDVAGRVGKSEEAASWQRMLEVKP